MDFADRDVLIYSGAKFLCPMAGDIILDAGHRFRPDLQKDRY